MNNTPLVTVVTPSFNQGQFLEETIKSVLNQDYPNIEYIIIDGGSTDDSLEIIKKYSNKLAYWVSEKDSGQSDAINKGWNLAHGKYITWINSDDVLAFGVIQNFVNYLETYSSVQVVFGDLEIIDSNSKCILYKKAKKPDWKRDLPRLKDPVNQPGFLMRQNLLNIVGWLNPDLYFCMDFEYFIRVAISFNSNVIIYIPLLAAYFRRHEGSKSNKSQIIRAEELLKIYKFLFSQKNLPFELKKIKHRSLSSAYRLFAYESRKSLASYKALLFAWMYRFPFLDLDLLKTTAILLGLSFLFNKSKS